MHRPDPPYDYPDYRSTSLRAPRQSPIVLPPDAAERRGPVFEPRFFTEKDADLTCHSSQAPQGQRIIVAGRVLDSSGNPVRRSLVEIWQCNAAGRYAHRHDQHHAPLDPHFPGFGRLLTDDRGWYRFVTIKPGAYPWQNHVNAWRPAHVHFSLFGQSSPQRLVTQMYFPGDPLLPLDPIYNSVPAGARERLKSAFDLSLTIEGEALGFRFDIVCDGRYSTPFEG